MTGIGYVVKRLTVKLTPPGASTPVAYECAVTGVSDSPTRTSQTSNTACPDGAITDVGPTSWEVTVDYNAVDDPAGFFRMLREHDGASATLDVEFDPINAPGRITHYDVTLAAGGQDATVGSFRTASSTFPVKGAPRYTDPVTP
jgi:hypothetical protein